MKKTLTILFLLIQALNYASLENYLEIAQQNNPGLKSAYNLYEASKQRIPQVTGFEPLMFDVGIYTPPMHTVDGEQVAQFQIMQMLPWFGTRSAARTEMSHMANMAYEEYREIRDQLIFDITVQWWTLNRLYQQLKNNQENKILLTHLEELALRRFATPNVSSVTNSTSNTSSMSMPAPTAMSNMSGMGGMGGMGNMGNMSAPMPPSNMGSMNMGTQENMGSMSSNAMAAVLRIQMEIAEIDNTIENLISEIKTEKAKFNALLGMPLESEVIIPDELTLLIPENSIILDNYWEQIKKQNPMLMMLEQEDYAIEAKNEMDKKMSYPMIGVGIQYMLNKEVHHTISGDKSMNGKDMIMPMASISIPLFRGQYKAQQRENQYKQKSVKDNYTNMLNLLEAELLSIKNSLDNVKRKVDLYTKQTEIAATLHNLTLQEFISGQGDLANVIQAQRELLNFQLLKIETIIDYKIIIANLEKIVSS